MINEQNLEKLYNGILEENELTTKLLNSYGFSSKDLKELVDSNKMIRVKRGHYTFNDVKSLFYYGKKLIATGQYEQADICFEKCYKLDPNNSSVCFQLFFRAVKYKDYDEAIKYFEGLSQTTNKFYNIDYNFYLYLLNVITDLPEKYKEHVKRLTLEDLLVDLKDKRFQDIYEQNKVRTVAFCGEYSHGIRLINNMSFKGIQNIMIKTLLMQAFEKSQEDKQDIFILIEAKQYDKLLTFLQAIKEKRGLNETEEYILQLVQTILDIKNNNEIPIIKVLETNDLFTAIKGCNYNLAYNISMQYNNNFNSNSLIRIIHLLLEEIYNLIYKITIEVKQDSLKFSQKYSDYDRDKEFVKTKRELLINGENVILLPRMKEDKIKKIEHIARKYGDIRSFCIDQGNKKRLVLTYKPFIEEHVDLKQAAKAGSIAYSEGQYDECISHYLNLIYFGYMKAYIYAKLGLSYLKKNKIKQAITYLTIANELNKKEDGVYDFTELLAKLNGVELKTDYEESKSYFKMSLEEFENGINDNYGIDNFEEIAEFIIESGVDVESACQQLLMNSEKVNKIRLLFAREYYSVGNFEKGDQFLKGVEKSKNKTKEVIEILEEIRKNKRFYSNRESEKTLKLSYSLQPGKKN